MINNFQSPGDIAFSIFNMPVYWYGIILAFAVFVGFLVAYFLYKKFYESDKCQYILDFSPIIIIVGILGARIYYCLVNLPYYIEHPIEILAIRQGGLSVHGMIIAGICALYYYSKKYNISLLKLLDVFLCASILAQGIGRWGNFFNSEAFGYPTDLPWKLYIPIYDRPLIFINFEYFHPTFLYESILDITIFLILIVLFKKLSKNPGILACLYLILYSLVRIFVEHFRIDSALNIHNIPIAQITSVVMIIIGITGSAFILYNKNKSKEY